MVNNSNPEDKSQEKVLTQSKKSDEQKIEQAGEKTSPVPLSEEDMDVLNDSKSAWGV